MTTLTLSPVDGRAPPRERPAHSTFAVAASGLAFSATRALSTKRLNGCALCVDWIERLMGREVLPGRFSGPSSEKVVRSTIRP
jgi:hypothetical protein